MKIHMDVSKDKLKQLIKEIAEHNDCGMNDFVNTESFKIIYIPIEFNNDLADSEGFHESDLKEIDENYHLMFKIEPPSSNESFVIMEKIADKIYESNLRTALINALNRRKPFANFKYIIDNSNVREDWFKHKTHELEKRVKIEFEDEMPGHNNLQQIPKIATATCRIFGSIVLNIYQTFLSPCIFKIMNPCKSRLISYQASSVPL